MNRFFVSTDQQKLQPDVILSLMKAENWCVGFTDEAVLMSLHNSFCFGVYNNTRVRVAGPVTIGQNFHHVSKTRFEDKIEQIGFARVLTDKSRFSCINDVVIEKKYRGHGLGRKLMEAILAHPDVKNTVCILGTKDAARFYEQFRFGPVPAYCMQRDPL